MGLLCPPSWASQHECLVAPARPLPSVRHSVGPQPPSLVTSGLSSPLCAASPLGRLCAPLLFPFQPGLWLFITGGWWPAYLVLLSASMFCHRVTALCQDIHNSTCCFFAIKPHFALFNEHVLSNLADKRFICTQTLQCDSICSLFFFFLSFWFISW